MLPARWGCRVTTGQMYQNPNGPVTADLLRRALVTAPTSSSGVYAVKNCRLFCAGKTGLVLVPLVTGTLGLPSNNWANAPKSQRAGNSGLAATGACYRPEAKGLSLCLIKKGSDQMARPLDLKWCVRETRSYFRVTVAPASSSCFLASSASSFLAPSRPPSGRGW